MYRIHLKTRDWETMLSYTQKEKYKNAIRQGYFSTYHGTSWRHDTFYGAYIWKHPNRVKVLARFENMLGHRPEWSDITDDTIRDLVEELREHYSPNSVKTFMAEIFAIIRQHHKSKNIPLNDYHCAGTIKKSPSQAVYLTMSEINKIRKYQPETHLARYVKRLFMIECLTGARKSDCQRITTDNIDDNGQTLTYVSEKTKTEVTVPIHRWLKPFLVSGDPLEPKTVGFASFSRIIREICKACGINEYVKVFRDGKHQGGKKYEFVTSHTGRRSFATNLIRRGVSVEQIALMMGHMSGNMPNIEMTQRYIVGKMKIDGQVLKLFGVYDEEKD